MAKTLKLNENDKVHDDLSRAVRAKYRPALVVISG